MKLEQRIGRVDRIGQEHAVRAVNFVVQDTVEHRVREVLEEKLAVILEEFGVDKTGDILDSAQAGQLFDDLYVEAILRPDALSAKVDSVVSRVKEQGQAVRGKRVRPRRLGGPRSRGGAKTDDPPAAPLGRADDGQLRPGARRWRRA